MKYLDIMLFRFEDEVIGKVITQMFIGPNFGIKKNGLNNIEFCADSGITLSSMWFPQMYPHNLFVKGDNIERQNECLYLKFTSAVEAADYIKQVKSAVGQYNEEKTREIMPPVRVNWAAEPTKTNLPKCEKM